MRSDQENDLRNVNVRVIIKQPRPSKVTRLIQAAKAKGTEKNSEAMVNEHKKQRNIYLEYY